MTAGERPDARAYYTQRIPAEFNRLLDAERSRSESGAGVYEEMRAVDATVEVEILGDGPERYFLNIAAGRMSAGDSAHCAPFLSVSLDRETFARVAAEAGDSLTGLLGALAGLGGDMRLTRKRLRELEAVAGTVRFEVTGEAGFSLLTRLGSAPRRASPDATIRMDAASYRALRCGRLDPQQAFLTDAIQVEGDVQKVMQLAFAAVAPD